MEDALQLKHVTKRYGDYALEDLNLTLPAGCILGLIGENGAGKTTAIKSIIGAVHPDEGEIYVLGCENRKGEFLSVKQEIGVVLDESCFPGGMTPRQVSRMMEDIYANWNRETFFSYLKRFDLPEGKLFQTFSRGMKMKLSLAAALSHGAKLLILDEPTGGLDPIARDDLLDVLMEFTRDEEHSILISSHIISDLEKISDYVAFLHKGRLLFCEEKDRLEEGYGVVTLRREDFEALLPEAVLGSRDTGYGVEALVRRDLAPAGLKMERAGIERIMVAMAKEAGK